MKKRSSFVFTNKSSLPRVGALHLKYGKRNMFVTMFDKKTNQLLGSTSARREYKFLKQIEKTEKRAGKQNKYKKYQIDDTDDAAQFKERAGAIIKSAKHRRHVLFTVLFKIYKIDFRLIDIRLNKKYSQRFLKPILKLPFKYKGLIRQIEVIKQKPHGYMRKRKLRKL